MKNLRNKIAYLCIMLTFQSLEAEVRDVLSLKLCMEYAIKNSTKMKIHRTTQSDNQIERRNAILKAFTPSISVGSSAYYNFGRAVDPDSNTYTDVTSFNNNYALNASMTLFDGFATINHIRIANTMIKMGMTKERELQNELCIAVMEAYFNVQFQSQLCVVLREQVDAAKENVKLIAIQYEQGQKGYADKVQMEANLAEKEYRLITTENKLKDVMLTLKDLMLWPVDDNLDLLPISSPAECIGSFFRQEAESLLITSDEITTYAKNYHPTSLIAKGELEKARLDLRSAKSALFPRLTLSGGWSTNYYTYPGKDDYHASSFSSQFNNNRGSFVQLAISFPIYNQLSIFSNISRKKNAYRRAQATYDQTRRDIESEVNRAIQDCKGAYKASKYAEKQVIVQDEAFRLSQKKLRQGLISPVEYHTISGTYLQAKAEQLNALFTYLIKQSVVNYYRGINYIDQLR